MYPSLQSLSSSSSVPIISYPPLYPPAQPVAPSATVAIQQAPQVDAERQAIHALLIDQTALDTFDPKKIDDNHPIHQLLLPFVKPHVAKIIEGGPEGIVQRAETYIFMQLLVEFIKLPNPQAINFRQTLKVALEHHFYRELSQNLYETLSGEILQKFERENRIPERAVSNKFLPLSGDFPCPFSAQTILDGYKTKLAEKLTDAAISKLKMKYSAGQLTKEEVTSTIEIIRPLTQRSDKKKIYLAIATVRQQEQPAHVSWVSPWRAPQEDPQKAQNKIAVETFAQQELKNIEQPKEKLAPSQPILSQTISFSHPHLPPQGNLQAESPALVQLAEEQAALEKRQALMSECYPLLNLLKQPQLQASFDPQTFENSASIHAALSQLVAKRIEAFQGDTNDHQIQACSLAIQDLFDFFSTPQLGFSSGLCMKLSVALRHHFYLSLYNKMEGEIISNFKTSAQIPQNLKVLSQLVAFLKVDAAWNACSQEQLEDNARLKIAKQLVLLIIPKLTTEYLAGTLKRESLRTLLEAIQVFQNLKVTKWILKNILSFSPEYTLENARRDNKVGFFASAETQKIAKNKEKIINFIERRLKEIEKEEKQVEQTTHNPISLAAPINAKDPQVVWDRLSDLQKKDALRHVDQGLEIRGAAEGAVRALFPKEKQLSRALKEYSAIRLTKKDPCPINFKTYLLGEKALDLYYADEDEDAEKLAKAINKCPQDERFFALLEEQLKAAAINIDKEVEKKVAAYRKKHKRAPDVAEIKRKWLENHWNSSKYFVHSILALERYMHTKDLLDLS